MKKTESAALGKRRRIWWLLCVLAVMVSLAFGVRWWLAQPVVLEALDSPPPPTSPFLQVSPKELSAGRARLQSEPLIQPFMFSSDPYRRKIHGFEVIYSEPFANTSTGFVYFDTRKPTFNAFGDRNYQSDQLVEAHAAKFEEVPRNQIEDGIRRYFRRHQLSDTKRLFQIHLAGGEYPRQFWFVHDSSPAAEHFLWVARKSVESTPESNLGGMRADLGLRLFGPQLVSNALLRQPMRLSGYRGLSGFGMMQFGLKMEPDGSVELTPDPNRHEVDPFGDPTGMTTSMGYRPITCAVSPVELIDSTGQNRRILRLTPTNSNVGGMYRWGLESDGHSEVHFDLVHAPQSDGRHRLLLWENRQLRNVVHLRDQMHQRENQLAERLRVVPASEREALLLQVTNDPELHVQIEKNHVVRLSVTGLTNPEDLARVVRSLPALTAISWYSGRVTATAMETISNLSQLHSLSFSGCSIDNHAFPQLGRITRLKSLSIRQAERFPDSAMEFIAGLTNLNDLSINREFYSRPDDWQELVMSEEGISRVTSLNALTYLDLHGQNATDENCRQIASMTGLKTLMLSGENLSDAGLAALKPLTNLTRLHLWDVAITPEGAESFKRPGLDFEPGPFGREHD